MRLNTALRQRPCRGKSRGAALLESMLALLLLTGGIFSLGLLLTRLQIDTRSANHRATALRLIADMRDRMILNRTGFSAGAYQLAWTDSASTSIDCTAAPCNATQLASADLSQWLDQVELQLPGGQARIFPSISHPRQTGIAIAWAANEQAALAQDAAYLAPFQINAVLPAGDTETCPEGAICHVAYIEP